MNVLRTTIISGAIIASIAITGCASIDMAEQKVLAKVGTDLDRTVEMAQKYESPAVLQCAKYLQIATQGVKELAAEPTAGVFSSAFKAALLNRMGKTFEDAFAEQCGGVAARLLVELGRKAPIPGK